MNKKCILFVFMVFCAYLRTEAQNVNTDNFSEEYVKFTNSERQFNDWSISVFGGVPWLQSADFTSIDNGMSSKFRVGYDVQASINKQISHVIGISLMAQLGETKQGYGDNQVDAYTEYLGISLLGDLNLSGLLRRVDNRSPYRWSIHAYAGVGILSYKAYAKSMERGETDYTKTADVELGLDSFYAQVGAGLSYKISRKFDATLKAMYVVTGDNQFDGSGKQGTYADLKRTDSDNFITTSLGLTYKIGKHNEFLSWVDPLREIYTKTSDLEAKINNIPIGTAEQCVFGDKDDDGVCDDWDRELDTPKGARVDGSGRALDVDMDGIIDLYDKCPTFPGKANTANPELNGCPDISTIETTINDGIIGKLGGIQFNFDSDKILEDSKTILNQTADVILKYGEGTRFIVEGHTDAVGTDTYNMNLSKRRVTSVIKYLVSKGVPPYQLIGKGKGSTELKNSECKPASKCPEFKNRENRRVVFKLADNVPN